MRHYKGTVKGSVIVLERGVQLPEGTRVEVRVPSRRKKKGRQEAFQRLLGNPVTRYIGIDAVIEDDKHEREHHGEHGGAAQP
jgi:hypothetical protein